MRGRETRGRGGAGSPPIPTVYIIYESDSFLTKTQKHLARGVVIVYTHKAMSELIRNLKEAMEEMAKTGNEKGVIILENAIEQANRLVTDKQVSG